MRALLSATLAVSFCGLVATHVHEARADVDLTSLVDHVDDLYTERSSHATVTMKVVTDSLSRELTTETWSKGQEKLIIRILSPEKEAGNTTLRNGSNVWNYFPKINQVTKLSSSLLSAPWMGSHVTNSEITKHSRMSDSYTLTKTFEGDRSGDAVIELTLDPKPGAAVVWGRVVITIRSSDKNPTVIKYFDDSKKLSQTWTFSDVQTLGGRTIPNTVKIVPAAKPSESTEIRYKSLKLNVKLDDDVFSVRAIQK